MGKVEDRTLRDKGDKAVIDHVAEELTDTDAASAEGPMVHSPTTSAGEAVEEQVQKEWDPKKKGGLPTFLK